MKYCIDSTLLVQTTIEAWEKTHDDWHDSLKLPATRSQSFLLLYLVKSFSSPGSR